MKIFHPFYRQGGQGAFCTKWLFAHNFKETHVGIGGGNCYDGVLYHLPLPRDDVTCLRKVRGKWRQKKKVPAVDQWRDLFAQYIYSRLKEF